MEVDGVSGVVFTLSLFKVMGCHAYSPSMLLARWCLFGGCGRSGVGYWCLRMHSVVPDEHISGSRVYTEVHSLCTRVLQRRHPVNVRAVYVPVDCLLPASLVSRVMVNTEVVSPLALRVLQAPLPSRANLAATCAQQALACLDPARFVRHAPTARSMPATPSTVHYVHQVRHYPA